MKGKAAKWADVVIESINYIIINYALSNMALFFRRDLLYILFFASEVWLLGRYWRTIFGETGSKLLTAILTVCCFCVHIAMVYFIGYISGNLIRFGHV